LREDSAGRRVGRVEAIFEVEDQAERAGLFAGLRESEAGEVGDFDFAAVDGEAHGDEGGKKSDDDHRQGAEGGVEDAIDGLSLHGRFRIQGRGVGRVFIGERAAIWFCR